MKNKKNTSLKRHLKLDEDYKDFASFNEYEILYKLDSKIEGLSKEDADSRLKKNGKNIVVDKKRKTWFHFFKAVILDQFILIMLSLGIVSIFLDDLVGAIIIFLLALLSAILRFQQEYSSYLTNVKLENLLVTCVQVRRGNLTKTEKIAIEDLVVGDIIIIGAGSIIPADIRVLESNELFVSEGVITGESLPIEKFSMQNSAYTTTIEAKDICFMGSTVISGSAVAVVIRTGKSTYLGNVASFLTNPKPITNFDKGIKKVTMLLLQYMMVIVFLIFIINGFFKHDWLQALFFSISVAVGITPSMLPMIINVNLSKGAISLSKQNTIVKNINSIQNLGAIDTICIDKTGTITKDKIRLQKYLDVDGKTTRDVLMWAFLNSYYGTGIKTLIDEAIIEYGINERLVNSVEKYTKVDEMPFDYERKRMSVVVKKPQGDYELITKGALEEILKVCSKVKKKDAVIDLSTEIIKKIESDAKKLHDEGMHIIALASKSNFTFEHEVKDEIDMTFIGYIAFSDMPKDGIKEVLEGIKNHGINIKVLTGDSPFSTQIICAEVGLNSSKVIIGKDLEKLNEIELKKIATDYDVFARLSPLQKEEIISILKSEGHVVGFLGDGVNDVPALRIADIGISVENAADIAKESSDIILLKKDLNVLSNGILEGRRIYGNIIKYIKMTLSSNFGNVFSVLLASLFLPFLPMLPIQILIQNLIYDFSQISIPFDNVDYEFTRKPQKWDTSDLKRFMNVFGLIGAAFDIITFIVLWFVLKFNTVDLQSSFQTGWFIVNTISAIMVVHFIRTKKIPFAQSIANKYVLITTGFAIVLALLAPIIFINVEAFNFVILGFKYFICLFIILFAYLNTVEIIKKYYIKKYNTWL